MYFLWLFEKKIQEKGIKVFSGECRRQNNLMTGIAVTTIVSLPSSKSEKLNVIYLVAIIDMVYTVYIVYNNILIKTNLMVNM